MLDVTMLNDRANALCAMRAVAATSTGPVLYGAYEALFALCEASPPETVKAASDLAAILRVVRGLSLGIVPSEATLRAFHSATGA